MMYTNSGMRIYDTKQELYNDVLTSEKDRTIIPFEIYRESDGEFLGYIKYYVD